MPTRPCSIWRQPSHARLLPPSPHSLCQATQPSLWSLIIHVPGRGASSSPPLYLRHPLPGPHKGGFFPSLRLSSKDSSSEKPCQTPSANVAPPQSFSICHLVLLPSQHSLQPEMIDPWQVSTKFTTDPLPCRPCLLPPTSQPASFSGTPFTSDAQLWSQDLKGVWWCFWASPSTALLGFSCPSFLLCPFLLPFISPSPFFSFTPCLKFYRLLCS